jgi:general secretion pathway protein C
MRRISVLPLVCLALALCAWLQARGFAALVGGGLAAPDLHVVPEAQAAPEPMSARNADPILARNPFDSVTGPLLDVPAAEAADLGTAEPATCDGVRVVAVVASVDPDWSLVMLDLRGEREPVLRRRGGEILAIGVDRVLLERDGKPCVARIFAPSIAAPPAPPVAAASADARGIVRTGPDSFALDRSARDALIEGAGDLMRSVAVRPEKQGDDVVGLRITTLKPGTPIDALGVRAGDVLVSLDGIPLTSPDRMLEAYARVRTAMRISAVVLRDGRPRQIDFEVR